MRGATELIAGEVFADRYEIQRLLGEGDRKRTYLAHDRKVDRLVALSLVKPDAALSDPEGTEREAKVLGRIGSNANIVSLYDYEVGADGSVQYIVFQYLSGGTLTEYLRSVGQLPLDDILRFGRQLCRGLSHLHKDGLIHRDVSPDNVWLDEHHAAHLGDFDSAITINSAGTADSQELRPITTNSFAAPEEREGWPLDVRTDLFSLGGVLHVVATGGGWPGDLTLLSSQRPDLPSSFGDLLADMLAESPEDRPPDAATVLQRLDEIRHASNVSALIAAGESDKVEFKASLHHPYDQLYPGQVLKEVQKQLRKGITKTIAAFLNTDGGTLLIGVGDSRTVLGIQPDFAHLTKGKQNADSWLLSLQETIINALGLEVWSSIRISLVPHGENTVAVVYCPRRASETWHIEDGGERFYMRAANGTRELSGSRLLRFIREHWPA